PLDTATQSVCRSTQPDSGGTSPPQAGRERFPPTELCVGRHHQRHCRRAEKHRLTRLRSQQSASAGTPAKSLVAIGVPQLRNLSLHSPITFVILPHLWNQA